MRIGCLSAAGLACLALLLPVDSFARQGGGSPAMGMMARPMPMARPMTPIAKPMPPVRQPINPPRWQPVAAGPLKGPAVPPPGYRDYSVPHSAYPQHIGYGRRGPQFGLPLYGYGYDYGYGGYTYANYIYVDPSQTYAYAQDPQAYPTRLTPAGKCWTENVQVSSDRSRDVRVTRC